MKHFKLLCIGVVTAITSIASMKASGEEVSTISASGSLPVIHIIMDNPDIVLDRENYVSATYWLEPNGTEGVPAIGSAEEPKHLQIRGRGNYTWTGFDKKPYRLLLDEPAEMCGLTKSDYFGLHAHADDNLAFMRNTLGFELSRRLGLDWTPSHQPVEVYLNGEYRGLYFCTELVRVSPERVNIADQADNDGGDHLSGGWLCEIDNYDTDPHISLTEGNGKSMNISHKTPLNLGPSQTAWLQAQMEAIDEAVYATDKLTAKWGELVDIDHLARFYIVNEIMDNYESFHGSCFLHRDAGADTKWKFGPVWDFGSTFMRGSGRFIWQDASYSQHWIGEMYKFPEFQAKVKEIWADFCANSYTGLDKFLSDWIERIRKGAAADYQRWPKYGNEDPDKSLKRLSYMLNNKVAWLGRQWGASPEGVEASSDIEIFLRGTFNNWGTTTMFMPQDDGTYTADVAKIEGDIKIGDADWETIDLGSNGSLLKPGEPYELKAYKNSPNITIDNGITDAHFVFEPLAQTLLVTGTPYEVPKPTEVTIYFRGDINTWGKDMPMTKEDDGTYTLNIDNLEKRFKIADANYSTVSLGGDNVTKLQIGVPYKLIKKGKNITIDGSIAHARMIVDMDAMTCLVIDRDAVEINDTPYGESIQQTYRLFNLQGTEMPHDSILIPGIYIQVDSQGNARKILVK